VAALWRSPDVWATSEIFGGNVVRQLLVPSSAGFVLTDEASPSRLLAGNRFGMWPAVLPGNQSMVAS
jgi:hypothetical protein